jgi:hypothetical protein
VDAYDAERFDLALAIANELAPHADDLAAAVAEVRTAAMDAIGAME